MGKIWTKEQRKRQAAFERRRYPTDLTDEEWEQIKPLLPNPAKRGRKRRADLREILNAIRYLARGTPTFLKISGRIAVSCLMIKKSIVEVEKN